MTYEQWRTAIEPKVLGTLNLQKVFGDSLDFFILLSSSAGIVGSYAQGNYSGANSFQDAFARHRQSLRQPVRTIDVGIVEGEGYTAENQDAKDFVTRQGLQPYKLQEFLATINEAIANPIATVPSKAQLVCGTSRADPSLETKETAIQRPDLKFSHIWSKGTNQGTAKADTGSFDVQAVLRSTTTAEEAIETTQFAIKQKLSHLLAMPADEVRADRSVASLGMDSLIAVELRNWITTKLEAQVQMFELMSSMPFTELSTTIAKRSRLINAALFEVEPSRSTL
jgi:hypothetical protein